MDTTDYIFTLIIIILILFTITRFLFGKFNSKVKKSTSKEKSTGSKSDKSIDSQEIVEKLGMSDWSKIDYQDKTKMEKITPTTERIDKLSNLKKAVVWSEILSKPLGLKGYE